MSSSATDTLVAVLMPKMGISVSEGTILEWRKQPGDWVEADETLADVTTDKVDVEIPSPASGRLARIVAEAGDTVPVGEPIAEIDSGAKAGQAHPDEAGDETPSPILRRNGEAADGEADRSGFISPVVRRIADKHDIDLSQVQGTGIGGRVRKKDVLAHVRGGNGAAKPAPVLHSESPYKPDPPAETPADGGRREPLTPMRKAIAEHMLASRSHVGALHDDRRGRHVARRVAAR